MCWEIRRFIFLFSLPLCALEKACKNLSINTQMIFLDLMYLQTELIFCLRNTFFLLFLLATRLALLPLGVPTTISNVWRTMEVQLGGLLRNYSPLTSVSFCLSLFTAHVWLASILLFFHFITKELGMVVVGGGCSGVLEILPHFYFWMVSSPAGYFSRVCFLQTGSIQAGNFHLV